MPLFHYRASDIKGNIVTGTLEAREERLVVLQLQQGGLIPLRITTEAAAPAWQDRLVKGRGRRVPLGDLVLFTQELAALLKAGLPLERSLQALLEVTTRPAMKAILTQVLRDLQSGKTFSEALGRHRVFSTLYVSLVRAGEAGGFLEEALFRLGDYLKTVSELRSYLLTALIYPMILAGVGASSLILMLLYVVPRFESFFKEMGQNLFWTTRMLIILSEAFRSYWWLGGLMLALTAFVVVRLIRTPQGRMAVDRFKISAPFLGDLNRRVAAAFFSKTLGTLLTNGVPLVPALQVVQASVNNRYLSQALEGVLANVEKGQHLSGLLKKVGMFPELFLQMVAIGEETGHLAEMLLSAADTLEGDARATVRRFLALLEPVLILVTAVVVAFIIVSLLLPILNMYEIQF
ncbi:MAG: type II secretion system F family protein [Deltaproteobacteria bacterium]|nr:type II secretion system F family protein [Deltaproteobacteria bacterium]